MGIAWRTFEMPKKLVCDEASLTGTYGKFIAEPFERGYGVTIGNGLRRILVSSLEGSAPTAVKFGGTLHEFSSARGVLEDVAEIVLNVKRLIVRLHGQEPKWVRVSTEQKGPVLAKHLAADGTVDILNPDHHLATVTRPVPFELEVEIGKGRGYVPAEKNKKDPQVIGVIPVDSNFSPVTRVNFQVEDTRVGQTTDYDRLTVEIWTNGSVSPKEALISAASIYQRHLDVFVGFDKLPEEETEAVEATLDEGVSEKLAQPVSELELSVRASNCLREARIKTIGDLVQKSEAEMLEYRNFGKKSLAEVKELLAGMGLQLGMLGAASPRGDEQDAAS